MPLGRCIFRKGERLLRPEMAEKQTECLKTPNIAHFYRRFNNDCVTYVFQSWRFYKIGLSCSFYTQNIKKYLLFTKISSKIVSTLKWQMDVLRLGQIASSQVTNKELIYGDLRIYPFKKCVKRLKCDRF